jgi:glutathione S-transferase
MDMFRGTADDILSDLETPSICSFPCLYPPAILHQPTAHGTEEVLVNQVGACMIYLADALGYAPATHAEKARANCMMMNAIDYIADGRSSFHPVQNTMSYHDQKEEGDRVSKEFSTGRMLKYLAYFHKMVHRAGPHAPVAGGPGVTFADFALFHVLDATVSQFNTDYYNMAWNKLDAPALKEYYTWMGARPNLVAYFASDRRFRKFHIIVRSCLPPTDCPSNAFLLFDRLQLGPEIV